MSGGLEDVPFDYDGALDVARKLWALALAVEGAARNRFSLGATALTDWKGPFRQNFETRVAGEVQDLNSCANGLKDSARNWASQWKSAMDENNRRRRQRQVDALTQEYKDKRSNTEKLHNVFAGDDSRDLAERDTSAAQEVALPTAPGFAATATPQRF